MSFYGMLKGWDENYYVEQNRTKPCIHRYHRDCPT